MIAFVVLVAHNSVFLATTNESIQHTVIEHNVISMVGDGAAVRMRSSWFVFLQ